MTTLIKPLLEPTCTQITLYDPYCDKIPKPYSGPTDPLQFVEMLRDVNALAATVWPSLQTERKQQQETSVTTVKKALFTSVDSMQTKSYNTSLFAALEVLKRSICQFDESESSAVLPSAITDIVTQILFDTTFRPQYDAMCVILAKIRGKKGVEQFHKELRGQLFTRVKSKNTTSQTAELIHINKNIRAIQLTHIRDHINKTCDRITLLALDKQGLCLLPSGLSFPILQRVFLANNFLTTLPDWICDANLMLLDITGNQFRSLPARIKAKRINGSENPSDKASKKDS